MTTLLLTGLLAFADTPEKTVQDFIAAFNGRDNVAMAREVVGTKPNSNPFLTSLPPTVKIEATLGAVKVDGDSATVEADLIAAGIQADKSHESIELRRTNGNWQIVPVDPNAGGMREARLVGFLAYMTGHPEIMLQAKKAAKKTVCLSNVKQLSLGTVMYANDHDEHLPKTSAGWKAAIMPYVKNEKIFHCPEDTSGAVSYFMDPRVAGRALTSFPNPSAIAMIVEGTVKKTAFRHAGTASLGYLDGHARIVKPEAMKMARTAPVR